MDTVSAILDTILAFLVQVLTASFGFILVLIRLIVDFANRLLGIA
jgi:hypothetical protein